MTVGEKIVILRRICNLSVRKLSKMLGVSRTTLYFWESDKNLPSTDNIIKISEIFNISLEVLLDESVLIDSKIELKNSTK